MSYNFVKGLDVSWYEPNIDWGAVAAAGYRFAFIKATEGIGYVDSTFATNWVGAKRVGIIRGAYHYLRADLDAGQQADLFLSTVKLEKGDLPPVLDLEEIRNEESTNERIMAAAKAWLNKVGTATGRSPIIYSSPYFLKDRVSTTNVGTPPSWSKKYVLWIANYIDNYVEGQSLPMQLNGWQPWKFWQYSDKGIVPGIPAQGQPTGVDLDVFRGSMDELYAMVGGKLEPVVYVVKAGDTLKSISSQYGLDLTELVNANPALIQPGMELQIPLPTPPASMDQPGGGQPGGGALPATCVTYVVRLNDTLGAIAVRYHVSLDAIVQANGIVNPNVIYEGQVLKIPVG